MTDDRTPRELPPFPVDDFTLDQLQYAMNTCIEVTEEGEWRPVRSPCADGEGGEFTLSKFLDFMSGHDPDRATFTGYADFGFGELPVYEAWDPKYTEESVIRALVAEVRRLRGHQQAV